jgi:hypothetical protein
VITCCVSDSIQISDSVNGSPVPFMLWSSKWSRQMAAENIAKSLTVIKLLIIYNKHWIKNVNKLYITELLCMQLPVILVRMKTLYWLLCSPWRRNNGLFYKVLTLWSTQREIPKPLRLRTYRPPPASAEKIALKIKKRIATPWHCISYSSARPEGGIYSLFYKVLTLWSTQREIPKPLRLRTVLLPRQLKR